MKALGYSQGAIALKYIVYAFVAGVAGSILGCSLGMYIFPLVIFNAWNLMYNLPPLSFVLQPALMFGASALVIGVTILAVSYTHLDVYKRQALSSALTTLSSLNIIVFITHMIFVVQDKLKENKHFIEMNNELKNLNEQLKEYADIREKMGETRERNRLARCV